MTLDLQVPPSRPARRGSRRGRQEEGTRQKVGYPARKCQKGGTHTETRLQKKYPEARRAVAFQAPCWDHGAHRRRAATGLLISGRRGASVTDIAEAFAAAFSLVYHLDSDLGEIVLLSLQVSVGAVAVASAVGLPLGAAVALFRFPGRGALVVLLNALMGLPPVVVGLVVYLVLSRAGPLGVLGLLFTPTAMVIAQVLLVTPIIAALARQVIEDMWGEYEEQLRSLGATPRRALRALLWDGRWSLLTAVLAGFGRAIAEVGAVMIVGGNIDHVTRVMTTAIALEVSKGDLALALGLGIVLVALSIAVSAAVALLRGTLAQAQAR